MGRSLHCNHAGFNPRTHTGCDKSRVCLYLSCTPFQSTHPHRVRPDNTLRKARGGQVSIHAPTRGATAACKHHKIPFEFQSTHPHGVRHRMVISGYFRFGFNPRTHTGCDSEQRTRLAATGCFNPRTHTGCDACKEPVAVDLGGSIHAPTRGATPPNDTTPCFVMFQSTHPHGVRRFATQGVRPNRCFNPRTHTGCDSMCCIHYAIGFEVSIHAPTRGATFSNFKIYVLCLFQSTHPHGVRLCAAKHKNLHSCFNPRTHTGCDQTATWRIWFLRCFNPRTHTGCDDTTNSSFSIWNCFNPRTHTGCDGVHRCAETHKWVSIHAPTRGATSISSSFLLRHKVSIHAPTRGAT